MCQTAFFELVETGHLNPADTPLSDAYSTPGCLGHTAPGPEGEPTEVYTHACAHTHTYTHTYTTALSHFCQIPMEIA